MQIDLSRLNFAHLRLLGTASPVQGLAHKLNPSLNLLPAPSSCFFSLLTATRITLDDYGAPKTMDGQGPTAMARQAYYAARSPQAQAQASSGLPAEGGQESALDAPTYPFPQQQESVGPSPFKQYSQFYPRSPPRSRASSVASLSSAHDSLASTDPSDAFGSPHHGGMTMVGKHPIRLHASGGQSGFLVEVSGGEDPGVWPVAWSELIGLLSNRECSRREQFERRG